MAADQSVFVPDQSHHHDIEDRQDDEAESARVREAVQLVDDEEAKDDKRNRIGPELVSEEADDEEYLDKAVAEEIEGVEVLGTDGRILCQAQEMRRNKIMRVFNQFFLSEPIDQS